MTIYRFSAYFISVKLQLEVGRLFYLVVQWSSLRTPAVGYFVDSVYAMIQSTKIGICPVIFEDVLLCFSYKAIVDYIDAQYEAYLQEELKVKRALHSYHDTRIHVCLYFVAPTGHSYVV